jgi:hypothetical protein
MKITLKKDGNIEVKYGVFAPVIVGTWETVSTWEHQGNDHNLYERKWWRAILNDGRKMEAHSRKDLVKVLNAENMVTKK